VIGTHYEGSPIAPVPELTRYIDAGAQSLGVEYRRVDAATIAGAYGDIEVREAGDDTPQPPILQDEGLTLHVCDGATGDEYLRFDLFEDNPHYHYIAPGRSHVVVPFDRVAGGDMRTWAVERLRSRLRPMLELAGATDLAGRVTPADIDAAVAAASAALTR